MTNEWNPVIHRGDEPLYLTLVRTIGDDIGSGKLPEGTRLPTHRELADQIGVAIGTVTRAYIEAEKRGLIYGDGRRGTFVGHPKKDKTILSAMFNPDSEAIDFSKNYPIYSLDPDLSVELRRILRDPDIQGFLQYAPAEGYEKHRIAAADWMIRMGHKCSPDSVVVTGGAQHALLVILAAVTGTGDTILAEDHTYPGIKAAADNLGINLLGVEIDDEGIIPESLETICRQRNVRALYCNPTMHNPTNLIMSDRRRKQVAVLADIYDFLIIEDDILRPYGDNIPMPIASYAPDRTFFVISASKAISAGLRVGYISSPTKFFQSIVDSLRSIMLAMPSLPVEILSSWLSNGTADKVIENRKKELIYRQRIAGDILGQNPGDLENSYHLWLKLPDHWSTIEFTMEASRRGVLVTPAEIFATDKRKAANAIRLSLASVPNRAMLKKGLEIIAGMIQSTPQVDSTSI